MYGNPNFSNCSGSILIRVLNKAHVLQVNVQTNVGLMIFDVFFFGNVEVPAVYLRG